MAATFAGTKRVQIPCQKATYMVALARECPRLLTQRGCNKPYPGENLHEAMFRWLIEGEEDILLGRRDQRRLRALRISGGFSCRGRERPLAEGSSGEPPLSEPTASGLRRAARSAICARA